MYKKYQTINLEVFLRTNLFQKYPDWQQEENYEFTVLHKEKQAFYAGRRVVVRQSGRVTLQIWGVVRKPLVKQSLRQKRNGVGVV